MAVLFGISKINLYICTYLLTKNNYKTIIIHLYDLTDYYNHIFHYLNSINE